MRCTRYLPPIKANNLFLKGEFFLKSEPTSITTTTYYEDAVIIEVVTKDMDGNITKKVTIE